MAFTKEQQDDYFFRDKCPFCGDGDISSAPFDQTEIGKKRRECCCNTCEQQWNEVYDFLAGRSYLQDLLGNADDYAAGSGVKPERRARIGELLGKYRATLEEKRDYDLLGDRLKEERESAIEERIGALRDDLEDADDEELLGDYLNDLREDVIEQLVEQYREELLTKPDEQLYDESASG